MGAHWRHLANMTYVKLLSPLVTVYYLRFRRGYCFPCRVFVCLSANRTTQKLCADFHAILGIGRLCTDEELIMAALRLYILIVTLLLDIILSYMPKSSRITVDSENRVFGGRRVYRTTSPGTFVTLPDGTVPGQKPPPF